MQDKKYSIGAIISADLTVPNAEEVKHFYTEVIGWDTEELKMSEGSGEYSDYVMKDNKGNWIGGVCHQRGVNADLPPKWIVYINVANIEKSIQKCRELGGKVLKESKNADGTYQYALIEDPAGAILAVTKEPDSEV